MEEKQDLTIKGSFVGVLYKEDGTVTTTRKDNAILKCGFDFIADSIGKATGRPAPMTKIAVGSDNGNTHEGLTGLRQQIMAKSATYQHIAGAKAFSLTTKFEKGEATGAIYEAGVCGDGGFLDRVTFPVVNKGANDTYEATFTFTMS